MTSIFDLFSPTAYNASYPLLAGIWFHTAFLTSPRGAYFRLQQYDNVNPRQNLELVEKTGKVKPATIAKIRRKAAAHENGFESLPMIAAAVVAGNQVGLSAQHMNTMCVSYLAARIVFVHLYVNTTSQTASYLRSLFWWIGNACWLTTLIKAGKIMANK